MRESEVAQSGLTLSDPMDCSPPGSSIHGISQARVLEWGAIGCASLHQLCVCAYSVAQSYLTLCNPMDRSPPGSSVHVFLQARILEWVAFPSPGDLPHPRIKLTSPAFQVDSLLLGHQGSPMLLSMYPLF